MAMVTCHTPGCENNGVTIDAMTEWQDEETGETRYVSAVSCGPCGQPITDIDPPLPGGDDAAPEPRGASDA